MTDRVGEEQRIREGFKRPGDCDAFKVFALGSNGTVYAGCGLYRDHEDAGEDTVDVHIARHEFPDGSVVTFQWPL